MTRATADTTRPKRGRKAGPPHVPGRHSPGLRERPARDAAFCPPLFPDVPPESLPPLPTRREGMERMRGPQLADEVAAFAEAAKAAKAAKAGEAEQRKGSNPHAESE